MGKSLYTTIRELVENSLDACESVGVLPSISINIDELTVEEYNIVRGLVSPASDKNQGGCVQQPIDAALSTTQSNIKRGHKSIDFHPPKSKDVTTTFSEKKKKQQQKRGRKREVESYFQISVRDNGCGMAHDAIPNLLGRVLSGSKYGVRQTRGKFGLGAKMALIWSKKSTNMPIKVKTAHMEKSAEIGSHLSTCVLDIDIYKNCPRVIEHKKKQNNEDWIGTEIEVLIAGNWTNYKSRIVSYLQQLAIITPYAQLNLNYHNLAEPKKDLAIRYERRSEQMPHPAKEVKHHPASVNNLLVQQLLLRTKEKTLGKFLCNDLSGVSSILSKRLITELGSDFHETMDPLKLNDKKVTRLVQLLRSVDFFRPPDGSCLSPLGEYNLNLGIRKVLEPDFVATSRDKPSAYEGHPFIVEAAVSVGGKDVKEGITVIRFANRIPLLFEGGADVATRVAQSKIRWATYKIDQKRDRIGVFVSIVSTKIPFKGTGKEYIGDDITEIQVSVKRALQSCCQQLRTHLMKKYALRDIKERKSRLVKYIPDVSRSIFDVLAAMNKRRLDDESSMNNAPSNKRPRIKKNEVAKSILEKIARKELTESVIKRHLLKAVEQQNNEAEDRESIVKSTNSNSGEAQQSLFLRPLYERKIGKSIIHPLFVFQPIAIIKSSKNGL